jgi:putative SOS response-associated peptidase YedK
LSRRKQIEEHFGTLSDEDWAPRYNMAPTQSVPVMRQDLKEPPALRFGRTSEEASETYRIVAESKV